jgi:RHS repeat-associated protein
VCISTSCYTGKERDTESGNDYFLARYYNSALGRFTTPDWSAKTDPVPYAVFTDPQSLNLYAYVRNNPITRVDPDGHCFGGGWCDVHGNDYMTDTEMIHQDEVQIAQGAAARAQNVLNETPGQQTQTSTAQAKRDELAQIAQAQAGARSTKWAYNAPPCKGFKCSVFVHDMLALVGIGVNSGYKSGEGPVAADLANPKYHMAGWTDAQYKGQVAPGSIVAYAANYTDATGDSAIVTRIVNGVPYVVHAGRELVYEEPITKWARRDYQDPGGYYARTYVGP